jgi:hypothetical protein
MAFIPKISINIKNTCNKIDVWEKTDVYVIDSNDTGWGGLNIDTSLLVSADVKIYDYLGTTLLQTIILKDDVIDVYSPLQSAPTPPSFKAFSDISWGQPDGVYKLVYTVVEEVTYVNDCQYVLFTCNLCNCLDNLIIKMSTICSGEKLTKYKEVIDQLEIFKYGISTAYSNGDFATVNILLAEASKICTTFTDCGCGCEDC